MGIPRIAPGGEIRFAQHFMDTSGKWRAVGQNGPANLEVWRSCWDTFAVAAVSLDIANAAVLVRYARRLEERCNRYAGAWHLCVKADEKVPQRIVGPLKGADSSVSS